VADEDPGGAISSALGQYNGGNTAEAQALGAGAIASALNQLARVVENLWKA
jgi:stage V sporulation protein SpoVS